LLEEPLPPVGAEMFMHAGAIVVERLVGQGAGAAEVEAALLRAVAQAHAN